jgi:hypothetical protein
MIELSASRGGHVATRGPRTLPASVVFLTILGLLTTGCGAGGNPASSGSLTTTIDTVAGVVHVMNRGAPPVWEFRELLTLGSAGGLGAEAADHEFGHLTGVLADGDGRIYVADAQSNDIRIFDPAGELLRRVGRQGGGPGEFGMLQSIGWIGDTLAALDPKNGRLALLRASGEWLGQRSYAALTGPMIRFYRTGPAELYMPMIGRDDAGGGLVYIRQTHAGPADTLPHPARTGRAASTSVVCRFEAGISFYSVDVAPKLVFSPAPGALGVQVWSADYRVAFTDAAGDTVRVVERDLPPLPVTNADWRAEEAKFQEWREQYAGASCEPARPTRPAAKSTLREIFFDDVGNTWVERRTADGWAYDLFDPTGRLLAEIPAPERYERIPPFVRDGRLYIVARDELDVEYVKVFAIERGGGS